ncbi:alginate export family protein [Sphingomonas glacialis]|uniref:Alginate export domain-containing protein n=1 Tax=Sphingomonas glacialis TaxID=658225 RepID=A0A502FWU9_9SPHN|nr:alginate export family protein [Sphingomonas glacialis]TPG54107.1 hypothetical protein EAH76_05240 [Sphingomonas glacialis]
MKMLSLAATALGLSLAPFTAHAQSLPASPASSTEKPGKEETAPKKDETGLIVTASSRLRYETVDGRPRPGLATAEDALELRTGIAVEYGPGPLSIGGELIDSRAYLTGTRTAIGTNEVDALELPQAYLKLRLDGAVGRGNALSVEGGRFLINLGSGRLIATDEYRNTVNGFTGLRGDLKLGKRFEATLFYVLPQERLPDADAAVRANKVVFDRETFDDVLFGGYVHRKQALGAAQVEFAYYRLAEHDSPGRETADRRLHTIDGRIFSEAKARTVDYDLEGAYQFGHASASTLATARSATVAAGFAHAAIGYSFAMSFKPRIGLFYDYASGNGRGGNVNRFDTLFGSRRDDLGPSGTYAGLARENISAPGIRFDAKPGKRVEALLDYRGIWLASRYDRFYGVTDATGRSGDFGGQQLEGRLRYWLVPEHLRFESNFALLYKGDFLENAPTALASAQHIVRFLEFNVQASF